jgi:hypothetical protein
MMLRYVSTWLERIAFQACSLNRSDISRFRINYGAADRGLRGAVCGNRKVVDVARVRTFRILRAMLLVGGVEVTARGGEVWRFAPGRLVEVQCVVARR